LFKSKRKANASEEIAADAERFPPKSQDFRHFRALLEAPLHFWIEDGAKPSGFTGVGGSMIKARTHWMNKISAGGWTITSEPGADFAISDATQFAKWSGVRGFGPDRLDPLSALEAKRFQRLDDSRAKDEPSEIMVSETLDSAV